jgi:hypothetical protein
VTLSFLAKRPDISRHIRELILRPNLLEWGTRQETLDESGLVRLIEQMAVNLPALQKFVWDGTEMPDDHLFLALRALYVGNFSGNCMLILGFHLVAPDFDMLAALLDLNH